MKKNKSLTVNAILNTIKQCCMIIFPMITFPYASRVLGVYNYGKINFASSIISYISLIAGLGISNYAIREGAKVRDNKEKINNFINEVFTLNIISTTFAYVILLILMTKWNRLIDYRILILVQSLTVISTTLGMDWINGIYEDYKFITVRYIVCQSLSILLMFLFVRKHSDYILYGLTSVSGTLFANFFNYIHIRKSLKLQPRLCFTKKILCHFGPVVTIFASTIATSIYINSDITILGVFWDDLYVGYYSVSVKIYSLVKQLINAMLVVAIPRLSNIIENQKGLNIINDKFNDILGGLIVIILPICIGLWSLSSNIIIFFAGDGYLKAITPLKILSVAVLFASLACFFVNVIMLTNRMENKILIATIVSAVFNIISNFILIPKYGIEAAAYTTLFSEMIMFFLSIIFTRNNFKFKKWKNLSVGIIASIVVFIVCNLVKILKLGNFITILSSISISMIFIGIIGFIIFKKEILYCIHKNLNFRRKLK